MKVLINGGGIGGPALATLLLRSNPHHDILIVERSPSLRDGGQQIDLRAQGISIMRKLGLLEPIKAVCVAESGMAFMDSAGRQKAVFGVNNSGKGQQGFTSEYEIMRGDFVHVLYEARGKGVRYEFGKYAQGIEQEGDGVTVTFSDGKTEKFDMVVGADGQGSRTRRMLFGAKAGEAAFHPLGPYYAFYSIPREKTDDATARIYHIPGSRIAFLRSGNRRVTQAILAFMGDDLELEESMKKGVDAQKETWLRIFNDVESFDKERMLRGLKETDDFYVTKIGQVKMDSWSKGRVVLLGDAGYCPSAVTGMGTTAALTGSYVLAGELARHGSDVEAALKGYDRVMRPFVQEWQKLMPGFPRLAHMQTAWGIRVLHIVMALIAWLGIDRLLNQLLPENKGGLVVPEYPELKLDS
ncbi:monooxygenase [Pseudomassariella vexata]|uniref:Monooxygenase n=1 Tax=Pseudomassariella vexata TaxID=1141098 RepID=A0A1Y2DGN7_9PEZI|nr:monooxygenase [Pseudomassariella vexata]ORY58409.1 monooxygenase [Pseudomassariella vexata]